MATLTANLIETTERERIEYYQKGWNDATAGRPRKTCQPIMYSIGYVDASRRPAQREVH
jgi:hypothetical protein